jgi:thiamine-phosphate pyrophosphorylase
MVVGRLHVIVNVGVDDDPAIALALARTVVDAGAPVLQVRAKGLADPVWLALAERFQAVCASGGARCVVNDRADIARAAGAAGVHVGEEDLPVVAARAVVGPEAIVGATARSAAQARAAAEAGASYVGVGPCYPTATKAVAAAPLGPAGLATVASAAAEAGVPVIAIAGVTAASSSGTRRLLAALAGAA